VTRRRVVLTEAAKADLKRLQSDNPALPGIALRKLRDLEAGRVEGAPLRKMSATGDLGDCRKLYFGPGDPPSHRIVYRSGDDGQIEVAEVVAVEARDEMYVYLLASSRLKRLPAETTPRYNRVHQRIVQARSRRRQR
jgi:hypothetical protein